VAWTILATNTGPSASNNAIFSDPVPSGLTITGTPTCDTATGGAVCGTVSVSGSTVTSTVGTFPALSTVTFHISAAAGGAGSYTNTASLTPVGRSATTSSLTTVVAQPYGLNETVRNVTKGDATGTTSETASPGDTLEYALNFTNAAGVALQNFVFTDALPANVTCLSAACGTLPAGISSCTPATPSIGGSGTITFTFAGTLASGNTLAATFRVVVK
jgi:uncharacterized repeat protein (TIGR01451 family)